LNVGHTPKVTEFKFNNLALKTEEKKIDSSNRSKKVPGSPLLPVKIHKSRKRNLSKSKMTITFNTIQRSSPLPRVEQHYSNSNGSRSNSRGKREIPFAPLRNSQDLFRVDNSLENKSDNIFF